MHIALLGASGRTGRYFYEQALAQGHSLTVLVRKPCFTDERVTEVIGDACDQQVVLKACEGADSIVSALGTDNAQVLSRSTPCILAAMQAHAITRVLTVGTAGILQSRTAPEKLRYETAESKRTLTTAVKDHRAMYEQLQASPYDWTILCPTRLIEADVMGAYRLEVNYLPIDAQQIARIEVADALMHLLTATDVNKKRIGIAQAI